MIEVAVGIAARSDGHVLTTCRPTGKVRAGQWEFPGGKLEPGEAGAQALVREWREELGVAVTVGPRAYTLVHHYPDVSVRLHVFPVTLLGAPVPQEGQALRWVAPGALRASEFVAADRYVLTRLRLPPLLLISNAQALGVPAWLQQLERALAGGVRMVQLREHGLPDAAYAALVSACEAACGRYDATLVLNRDVAWVARNSSLGVHVTAAALRQLRARPIGVERLLGVSCHNLEELAAAVAVDADYATLSPVCPTASHPAAPTLGWRAFQELASQQALPVFALGGLRPEDLDQARRHGAHGVAYMRGV